MMMSRISKRLIAVTLSVAAVISFTGCVDQSQGKVINETVVSTDNLDEDIKSMLDISDSDEKKAVEEARIKVRELKKEPDIIATSSSIAQICDKLNIELTGVCDTVTSSLPEKYKDVPKVGTPMSPDMEIVASLNPDWILSPSSLQADLQSKYEAIDTDWAFLNLRSVQGMYRSIQELGVIFDRNKEAEEMVQEFTDFYESYKGKNEGREKKDVLILMGLPGSYIIATENSYVGSLVKMAGGNNVYSGTDQEFLTVNTEDMKTKEPDIILCASHALPDKVAEMFKKDFAENDIWKHFKAVKDNQVFYLTHELFGMSATFDYPDALEELQEILYPEADSSIEEN